jgi:hypothetical protein
VNTDAKLLNKMLAKLIQQCIKNIFYYNQVGFNPGVEGWFTIHKSITIIQVRQGDAHL